MATSYPTGLDSFTNPTAVDTLDSPPHDTQHADANDAIEAIQAKVGVDSSAVTTSLDYRVGQLELGGGSMTTSSTAPSSPSDGDMWYDTDDGRTYVYYDDGTSQQWVEFGAPAVAHGKILQVVTNTYATSTATTSTSYIDSGLDATITPTSATSKIVVMTFGRYSAFRMGVPAGLGLQLVRGTTTLDTWADLTYADIGGIGLLVLQDGHSVVYEDSPATTSAITYKIQFNSVNTSCTATAQAGNTTSTMMLLEVSA